MFQDTNKNELAFDKSFVGSMAYQKNNNEDIHKIIANHTNEPTETGIAVYRAVDGIHDFESGLKKKNANTLLNENIAIIVKSSPTKPLVPGNPIFAKVKIIINKANFGITETAPPKSLINLVCIRL